MIHRCLIEGSSAACVEVDGEFWVKEYREGTHTEGRTYRVNYCPQCGQMSNPTRVLCDQLFKVSTSLSKKKFDINTYKQDCLQRELPTELREYTFELLMRVLQDLSQDKTVLRHEHKRYHIGQCLSLAIEKIMCWDEWKQKIPYLKFDQKWEVKVISPFMGAIIRFLVKKDDKSVSVYLDCYAALGVMDIPYWEVYPHSEDGPIRVNLNDTEELMQRIREGLEYEEPEED